MTLRLIAIALLFAAVAFPVSADKPVKVFILAGQSNMVGYGNVELSERRTKDLREKGLYDLEKYRYLDYLAKQSEEKDRYRHLLDQDGQWVKRDDVWCIWNRPDDKQKPDVSPLTVGHGSGNRLFGPELQFGHIMGNHFDERVVLIKTAWGGKSLAVDFRPPSAGLPADEVLRDALEKINERNKRDNREPMTMDELKQTYGHYYRRMIEEVDLTLAELDKLLPWYDAEQGYEIAGFVWFQGWNDGASPQYGNEYASNLKHLVSDVREKYGPIPVAIGTSGFGKHAPSKHDGWVNQLKTIVEPQQIKAASQIKNAKAFETGDCLVVRPGLESNRGIHHWYNSAESYFLIGDGLGKTMLELLGAANPDQ